MGFLNFHDDHLLLRFAKIFLAVTNVIAARVLKITVMENVLISTNALWP